MKTISTNIFQKNLLKVLWKDLPRKVQYYSKLYFSNFTKCYSFISVQNAHWYFPALMFGEVEMPHSHWNPTLQSKESNDSFRLRFRHIRIVIADHDQIFLANKIYSRNQLMSDFFSERSVFDSEKLLQCDPPWNWQRCGITFSHGDHWHYNDHGGDPFSVKPFLNLRRSYFFSRLQFFIFFVTGETEVEGNLTQSVQIIRHHYVPR